MHSNYMKTRKQIEAELIELHEERMRIGWSTPEARAEIYQRLQAKRSELRNAPEEKRRPTPRSPIEMLFRALG